MRQGQHRGERLILTLTPTGKGTADIVVRDSGQNIVVGTAKAISAGFWEADLRRAHPSLGPQGPEEKRGPMAHGKSGLRDLLARSIENNGPWWVAGTQPPAQTP